MCCYKSFIKVAQILPFQYWFDENFDKHDDFNHQPDII